jgi:putative membrane protein insertion efficiency factor
MQPKHTNRRRRWRAAPVRGLIFVIELYRNMVSPLRLPTCRFMPTCSEYAVEALGRRGLVRGGWLSLVRLAKCGPWHPGGWDPIPGGSGCADSEIWGISVERGESEHIVV